MDNRLPVKIMRIYDETPSLKTFVLSKKIKVEPGQFIMITDYENGEKPFSISDCSDYTFSITVKNVGYFTNKMFKMNVGNYLYFRGPYGKAFEVDKESKLNVLIVGGGCGSAPLYFLAKVLKSNYYNVTVINGAKTKDEVLFDKNYKYIGAKEIVCTDDGTYGEKGTSVEVLKNIIKEYDFDKIYTAGPEMMLKGVLDIVRDISTPCEFLLERYMKCAMGLCGQCTVDPVGLRLCIEGPVLNKETVMKLSEFGAYTRDASGKRIPF